MKTVSTILRVLVAVLVAVAIGWVAVALDVNVGRLIRKILGLRKDEPKAKPIESGGKTVGTTKTIVPNKNPLRDKGEVELDDGTTIELPSGMKDTDVTKVVEIKTGEYQVEAKHSRLTDVFD